MRSVNVSKISRWILRNIECWIRLLAIASAALFIGAPLFVFAYAPETTHKGLTDESVDFFNAAYPDFVLSAGEKEAVKKGSVDEDENTQLRWMRHFYDPIYKRGLTFEAENGAILSRWQSSKNWAQDTTAQADIDPQKTTLLASSLRYFDADTDYSWDRGIYEYAWGDKKRGLEALGHVLHLLQDATVPDHTRNDPHPPYFEMGSPYESWTDRFNEHNMRIVEELRGTGKMPVIFPSLVMYFEEVALYSNNNFFSKDTISSKIYFAPKFFEGERRLSNGIVYKFLFHEQTTQPLARVDERTDWKTNTTTKTYILEDRDNLILTNYWTRLSKQAVVYGAGVIKLFFDEVEKERGQKKLFAKQEQSGGILARIIDGLALRSLGEAGGKAAWGTFAGLFGKEQTQKFIPYQNAPHLSTLINGDGIHEVSKSPEPQTLVRGAGFTLQDYLDYFRKYFEKRKESDIQRPLENAITIQALNIQHELNNMKAQLIGLIAQEDGDEAELAEEGLAQETLVGQSPARSRPEQSGGSASANQETPWYTISQGGGGGQSAPSPQTSAGAAPPSPPPDTTPPDFSFSIKECNEKSFSSEGCVLSPQLLNLSWVSSANDLDGYTISCSTNGAPCAGFAALPTATSTTYTVADQQIYTFIGLAKDKAGNASAITTVTVEVWNRPVVINEVAWRGTSSAHAQDEWLELKNNASKAIDLTNWVLYSETDFGPYLLFAHATNKTIPANGYYLIERTDDTTISTIVGDFVAPFGNGLGNDPGETLALVQVKNNATTTMDRVPTCSNNWCGGSNSAYYTMERRDPLVSGESASNWGTNNGIIVREKDADGIAVLGTPKARNSLHYLIDAGAELSANKTLTKTNSPYIITDQFTVPAGKTLTIKEGVVIKFAKSTSMFEIAGTLKAEGKSGEEIVFTAFADDAYGGNTDDKDQTPTIGLWQHVKILSSATDTLFNYVRMRYGGKITSGDSTGGRALLRVDSAPVTITNSTFEYSAYYGIRLTGSNGMIATSTFSNMNPATDIEGTHAALLVSGGSPLVSSNTFTSNKRGIYLSGNTQAVIKGNTLTSHTDYPIQQSNAAAAFFDNSGSANAVNAILLSNTLGIANATTTLVANSLPFALSGQVTVPQNGALAIEKGVAVKGGNDSSLIVSGKILLNGATSSDIVFEANAASAPDGYWVGITLEATSKATLKGFTLRSAGGSITGGSSNKAGLRAKIPVTIENALIEKNRNVGVWMDGASTIRNTVFRGHTQGTAGAKALFINEIGVTLDTVTFSGNSTGISATTNATATSTGPVIFEGNTINTSPANLL